jgi:hypothetical protein
VVLGAGVGGIDKGRLMILPRLRFGSLTIERPETALSVEQTGMFGLTAPTDGTIGAKVFRHARIIFDYSRSEIIVEPHEGFARATSASEGDSPANERGPHR